MALHNVAAEALVRAQRQLEVDPRPGATSASDERRSVSCITSAPKPPRRADRRQADAVDRDRVAVAQLAGERECPRAGARRRRWRRRPATVPRSATSPVNTRSPLLQAGGDEHVAGERLARRA